MARPMPPEGFHAGPATRDAIFTKAWAIELLPDPAGCRDPADFARLCGRRFMHPAA